MINEFIRCIPVVFVGKDYHIKMDVHSMITDNRLDDYNYACIVRQRSYLTYLTN
jgi:hypothetical protein